MDKQLRLLAGLMVIESDLSKSAKRQLLNFIKEEATDAQVKALLMDGKIVKLDEQAEEIVNDRFENNKLLEGPISAAIMNQSSLNPLKSLYAIGAAEAFQTAAFILVAGKAAEVVYKRFLSKAARACKEKSGIEKTSCMNKFKNNATKEKIKVLQKALGMCAKAKDPSKCKAGLQKKILKQKAKLGE